MVRTIAAFVMLLTMTHAQAVDSSTATVTPKPGEVRLFREPARGRSPEIYGDVDFQYDKLRTGTAEYAELALRSTTGNFMIVDPRGKDPRTEPARLELESSNGIHIQSIIYPESEQKRFPFDERAFSVVRNRGGDPIRFRFKVRASHNLSPGDYLVKATLNYQLISDAGICPPQQVRVEMPVSVVDQRAKVATHDRSIAGIRGITPTEWAETILLAPLMLPAAIFMAIIGWDGC